MKTHEKGRSTEGWEKGECITSISQVKDVLPVNPEPMTFVLTDQSLLENSNRCQTVTIEKFADGSVGLRIPGYGTSDGHSAPIILELWEGRLRLIAWPNVNDFRPSIIDMEGARETARKLEDQCGLT